MSLDNKYNALKIAMTSLEYNPNLDKIQVMYYSSLIRGILDELESDKKYTRNGCSADTKTKGGKPMKGLMILHPTGQYVGKRSEYKTKDDFARAVKYETEKDIDIDTIDEGYMRYFPKGTEDSREEFGEGVGVYMCVDKYTPGAFKVWIA